MSGSGGWQQQVYDQPSMAIAGDFASNNVWTTADAGPGGMVAGPGTVAVGTFGWAVPPRDPNGGPTLVNNFGVGPPTGFVHREQQALIVVFLAYASQAVQSGYEITLANRGDFWVVNAGTTQALPWYGTIAGSKAYANLQTGAVSFGPTGTPTTGASATGSTITPETFSVTGSISGDVLTVTAVGSGTLYPGATISGGATVTGTMIFSQLTGTTGGVGTYRLSIPEQTVASTTISGTYGLLTIGTLTTTGPFAVGDVLNVSGSVVAGTSITANVTGSGGTGGTMVVNNNTNVGSQTISALSTVETGWYATTSGLPGELVKISSWVGTFNAG
jgi:hypothetical protein